jgi:hypothetical protein
MFSNGYASRKQQWDWSLKELKFLKENRLHGVVDR